MQITKKIIILLVLFTTLTVNVHAVEAPQRTLEDYTVPELVDYFSLEYGVDAHLAHYIASEESGYNPEAKGDMYITCTNKRSPFYGQPVEARGVYQITKCYHPNVTDEQAYNPVFNVDYGMNLIAQGKSVCKQQFSTCRNYYNTY